MKAITLWQPWASLCMLPRTEARRPFKTIETRSWPAPKTLIGQRIAIHAAQRRPEIVLIGEWDTGLLTVVDDEGWWLDDHAQPAGQGFHPLPLGAVVGTAVLADCVPMMWLGASREAVANQVSHLWVDDVAGVLKVWRAGQSDPNWLDVSDQLPFGDFQPGRWAWLLADAEQFDEPIPAKGAQRIWNWSP